MYKVTAQYCLIEEDGFARVYFLNGIPFTFDEVEEEVEEGSEIFNEAMRNPTISKETVYKKSDYLIAEEMHPLLSNIVLDPSSVLPD